MKISFPYLLIFLLSFSLSCKQKPQGKELLTEGFSTFSADSTGISAVEDKHEIFYGVMTPVEICNIFDRLAVPFNKEALNLVSNKDLYLSNSRAAINTGIFGVDFGYLKMFGLGQEMIFYMAAISDLGNKLGIPDNLLLEPMKSLQNDMAEPDSLMVLMNESFLKIEDHLRQSGRESTAGLIIMGGWVEALYLATHIVYNPANPDPEVIQKIAQQKYTLTSLLSFLKNYYDDPVVVYYSKKLKYLKNYFDTFDIYFKKGDLEINTTNKTLRASGSTINVTAETLDNIREYTAKLRTEMVTP